MLKDTDLKIPEVMDGNKHAYYLYVVRHFKRDSIIRVKKEKYNCECKLPLSNPYYEGYKFLGYDKGDFPNTEKLSKEIFSLPLYPSLKDEELKTVVRELTDIVKRI